MTEEAVIAHRRIIIIIAFSLLLIICSSPSTNAQQVLVNEDFTNYSIGNLCIGNKWTSSRNSPIINVSGSSPITFPTYFSSGGNYIKYMQQFKDITSYIHYPLLTETISDGDIILLSFIFRLDERPTMDGRAFIALNNTLNKKEYHFLRIFTRSKNNGFELGVSKGGSKSHKFSTTDIGWSNKVLKLGETYLVMAKYVVRKGKKDDNIYLWINPDLSTIPNEEDAQIAIKNQEDKLYLNDCFAGIDLIYNKEYPPTPSIDGIKLTRGTIKKENSLWNICKAISYNTAPRILKPIEDVTVLENAKQTYISLREYFYDDEDNTSDLNYSVTSSDNNGYKININPKKDQLVIDYNEYGTCEDCKATIIATDSNGKSTEQSFLITINSSQISFCLKGTKSILESSKDTVSFCITKTGKTNHITKLNYSLAGSAVIDNDYHVVNKINNGSIIFSPTDTSLYIYIKLIDDKIYEGNEKIQLSISLIDDDGNTEIISSKATTIIKDNDYIPILEKDQQFTITDNSLKNSLVGKIRVSSKMPDTKLQDWKIVKNINIDNDTNSAFYIDDKTGELFINDEGDFLNSSSKNLQIEVSATDGYNTSKTESITIKVPLSHNQNKTLFVSKKGADTNSGNDWNKALLTLQAAIDQAKVYGYKEIWVAKGIYFPSRCYNKNELYSLVINDDNPRNKSFIITKNIKLYGGFSGKETSKEQRNKIDTNSDGYISQWEYSNKTILSGDIGITADNTDNSYHVIFITDTVDSSTIIDGFTINDGNANGTEQIDKSGAGILCKESCNPVISGNIIKNNSAIKYGGGIYCVNNISSIRSNCIKNNSASLGGGISCHINSNINIISNHIINNTAQEYGGGIDCSNNSIPRITNNIISDNESLKSGGGIYCYNKSNAYIANNTIVNNNAHLFGGGIFCNIESTPHIINSILWGNKRNDGHNQFDSSGSMFPYIYYSAMEGGFKGCADFNINKNINLSKDNNSHYGPHFYNTNKNDWRIKLHSICNEKGNPDTTNRYLPANDISGYKRVHGTIDIGAYEIPLNKWPNTQRSITYGETNSNAGINESGIEKSTQGSFSFKILNKKYNVSEKQIDTIIFSPKNKSLYTIEDSVIIKIKKAILSVKADNAEKEFGSPIPKLSYHLSGFVNNDDSLLIDNAPQIYSSARKDSPIGDYTITVSGGKDNNYEFNYINAILTIKKHKTIVKKWPKISSDITYGQSISQALIDISDCESSVPGSFSFKYPDKILNAGKNQNVTIVFTPDNNKTNTSLESTIPIKVNKAILTLSADNKTIHYSEQKPEFSISYSGFQNNEDESVLVNQPIGFVEGEWPLKIGQHAINIDLSNVITENYKLIIIEGKLNIINNPPNPIGKIPSLVALENAESTTIDISNYFNDVEQQSPSLIYTVTNIPSYIDYNINSENQLIIDYKEIGTGGPDIITVRATDEYNDFTEQSFTIEVKQGKADFSISGNEAFKEGNIGTQRKSFVINKIGNTNQECSIEYSIKGNARITSDYIITGNTFNNNKSSGTLSFKPWEISKTIYIDIKGDNASEQNKDIQVTIYNPNSKGNSTATITNATATKTIINDDHIPIIEKNQSFYIDENSESGTSIGKVTATDIDNNNSLQDWIIVEDREKIFSLNSITGELTINKPYFLDREKNKDFTIAIKVSDGTNYSLTENVKIEINDLNDEVPTILSGQIFNVDSKIKKGYPIATILFEDKDITPSYNNKWEIVKNYDSDNDNIPAVIIEQQTGTILVNDEDEFNDDNNKVIELVLTLYDGKNTSSEETIILNIKNTSNLPNKSKLEIFPNPAKSFTIINSKEEGYLYIYNDSGKLTINKKIKKGQNRIPLRNLGSGVYYFVIKFKKENIEKTVIIE